MEIITRTQKRGLTDFIRDILNDPQEGTKTIEQIAIDYFGEDTKTTRQKVRSAVYYSHEGASSIVRKEIAEIQANTWPVFSMPENVSHNIHCTTHEEG